MPKINSSQITFVDLTDSRKLEVYINSNLPTTQIWDSNAKTYSPDWSVTNLQLTSDVYLDSKKITPTTIQWYTKVGTIETLVGSSSTLKITTNELSSNPIITYICRVKYQNVEAVKEITLTRVDTGLNGSNGNSAPTVLAQYSVDGTTGWTATLNTSIHKYVRHSYDGGANWTMAIKMVGEDGTSVRIKGTATSAAKVEGTDYYTLIYNASVITDAELGDSYLYGGNLYVCADSRSGQDYFTNVGAIQGPKGGDGLSSYVFIRYATDANGTGMSTNPSGKTYMGVYTSNTNTPPTTASVYTWSKFVGDNAKSIVLSGDSQVFKVSKDDVVSPTTIKVTAQAFNTTITNWTYSTNGGQTFLSTVPTGVSRNGNIITVTGSTLASNSIVIKASDGEVSDVFTVYKAIDGSDGNPGNPGAPAPIAFLTNENITFSANAQGQISGTTITSNIVAYNGTTKVTPTIGTITGAPTGMTITSSTITASNEIMLTITITNNSTLGSASNNMGVISIPVTSPVSTVLYLTWSKVNTGATGAPGNPGAPAYTAILTNESHVFAGDISNAIEGSATTQVLAYKGTTAQTVTISSVNGKTAATVDTDTGIAGLKFKCSALSGTSPTITFACTTSFVSANGMIPIVFTVDGVSFTKMFTYSIAFKGATGETGSIGPTGSAGVPATSYWLVSSASAVQKTSTGATVTTIPSVLTFTGKSQTGTNTPIDYACRWVVDVSTNGTSYTNISTSASNETSKSITVLTTYKSIRVRMYMAGGTSVLLDEQIIPVISDGMVDLEIGGRNLILNSNILYSNSEYRVASYDMSEDWELNTTYTLTLKGTTDEGKIFGVWANGSSTRVATLTYNASKDVYTSTFTTPATIASQTPKVINIYNTPSTTAGNATIEWIKLEKGNKATDWSPAPEDLKSLTFQLYAPKGFLLTNNIPEVTIEVFAYDGSQAITDATFAWYSWDGEVWVAINADTNTSLTVNKNKVLKSNVYKCEMTYKDQVYTATATIDDKTDVYDSLIRVVAKRSSTNMLYWTLYTTVYSDEGERDALLGPISETAPASPTTGDYWYKVDATNYTVTLMKYSGTAWATTTDKQEFMYDWALFQDATDMIALGSQDKVKIVTANAFSRVCTVQCNVFDADYTPLTRYSQVLNDPSDPIVSQTAPSNPIDGQLWIQMSTGGTYVIYIWNDSDKKWIMSEADSKNKVYVKKPTSYTEGDIWIVGGDYQPTVYLAGVVQTNKHLVGTMLKAQYPADTYKDSDWVEALNYREQLDTVANQLEKYKQYISVDDTGLTMEARGANGQLSEFKTKLTNSELGFYQGDDKVAYINNNQLNISKAQITNGLSVTGTSPILTVGGFAIIQESNGSLSIITNI